MIMKILFICENYYPHHGGAEVLFKNLAEGLVARGHNVSLLTRRLHNTAAQENITGVQVRRLSALNSRYVFSFSAFPRALKLAKTAEIIQTTTFNGAFPAWLAARLRGKPVILTVHEVWVGKWAEITGFGWLKSKVHDWLERCIYWLPFDHYVCVSQATKKDLRQRKIPEEKISVIHNGLDYGFWNPRLVKAAEIRFLRKKLGLQDKFVYLAWGRPGPSKGFEYFLQAVPEIARCRPQSVGLLMLSSVDKYPQKYAQLLQLTKQINMPENLRIISSLPQEELRTHIAMADCVVVPSTAEGFGYTAVEAMAMKKPLIVSDAGALPEIVGGQFQIFRRKDVHDLAEKVVKAVKGEFNRKEPAIFEWKRCVEGYVGVYGKFFKNS